MKYLLYYSYTLAGKECLAESVIEASIQSGAMNKLMLRLGKYENRSIDQVIPLTKDFCGNTKRTKIGSIDTRVPANTTSHLLAY